MSNLPDGFTPKGPLLECFLYFPQFREELHVLIREGFVKVTNPEACEWMKSKTSLAEYFKKWIKGEDIRLASWESIENAFGIKRHSLRKLAGHNGNNYKPEKSRAFLKIEAVLKKYREQEEAKLKLLKVFKDIKGLVLEAEDEEPETIQEIIQKISNFFIKNVDKTRHKRLMNYY